MKTPQFNAIVEKRVRLIRDVLAKKGAEYARGDRLSNFKRAAGFLERTPPRVCLDFMMKHWVSVVDLVEDFEKGEMPTPERINEKIGDSINYLILLEAIFAEAAEQ